MSAISSSTAPIFILGITQRSGTNFLFDLLRLHPDCGAPSTNWEDFLVAKSDPLVSYVSSVYSGWHRRGTAQEAEDMLYEQLGNGLISVLASWVKERRVITKTPSVRNLDNFFKLFPNAYLLILVRDGRAVAESRVKTFHESYETSARIWAEGANTILRFVEKSHGFNRNYLIVRYEDLWNEPERELRRIFAFSGLDAEKYDFGAATHIPVRGSSVFRGQEKGEVHWKPVEKTSDFNPVSRSDHWTRAMHARFEWIAGQQLAKLGYGIVSYRANENKLLWGVWNNLMDVKCQSRGLIRSLVAFMKSVLKSIFGATTMSKARRTLMGFLRPLSN